MSTAIHASRPTLVIGGFSSTAREDRTDSATAVDAPKTRLHLTRRGRIVLTALVAIPIVIAAAFFTISGGGAIASDQNAHVTFQHVTVESGQSLWQIAEKIAPSADPRDVIAAIIDLNGLPSSMVTPGQQLAIPTQYAH